MSPAPDAAPIVYQRWGVYEAELRPVRGHEQDGHRPVVIVSRDEHNQGGMVTALPLTDGGKKTRSPKPWEVVLPEGMIQAGITSWVLPTQIRALSTDRLRARRIAQISDEAVQRRIEDVLMDHLGIEFDDAEAQDDTSSAPTPIAAPAQSPEQSAPPPAA